MKQFVLTAAFWLLITNIADIAEAASVHQEQNQQADKAAENDDSEVVLFKRDADQENIQINSSEYEDYDDYSDSGSTPMGLNNSTAASESGVKSGKDDGDLYSKESLNINININNTHSESGNGKDTANHESGKTKERHHAVGKKCPPGLRKKKQGEKRGHGFGLFKHGQGKAKGHGRRRKFRFENCTR